jgi:hypothetical protein
MCTAAAGVARLRGRHEALQSLERLGSASVEHEAASVGSPLQADHRPSWSSVALDLERRDAPRMEFVMEVVMLIVMYAFVIVVAIIATRDD